MCHGGLICCGDHYQKVGVGGEGAKLYYDTRPSSPIGENFYLLEEETPPPPTFDRLCVIRNLICHTHKVTCTQYTYCWGLSKVGGMTAPLPRPHGLHHWFGSEGSQWGSCSGVGTGVTGVAKATANL